MTHGISSEGYAIGSDDFACGNQVKSACGFLHDNSVYLRGDCRLSAAILVAANHGCNQNHDGYCTDYCFQIEHCCRRHKLHDVSRAVIRHDAHRFVHAVSFVLFVPPWWETRSPSNSSPSTSPFRTWSRIAKDSRTSSSSWSLYSLFAETNSLSTSRSISARLFFSDSAPPPAVTRER